MNTQYENYEAYFCARQTADLLREWEEWAECRSEDGASQEMEQQKENLCKDEQGSFPISCGT